MKCYVCVHDGRAADAVAICIVCGMAVCKDHTIKEEISFWEAQFMSSDMSPEGGRFSLPRSLPRILCTDCYEAIKLQSLPLEFSESENRTKNEKDK